MRTSGGCWKSCALAVLVVVGALGCFWLWLGRTLNPPPASVTQVGEISRITGLILPPQTVLLEGTRWRDYFLVARLRFARAGLAQFLKQGGVKAGSNVNEQDPLGKCLNSDPGGAYDLFHDGCNIENGEEQILDGWRLKSMRHIRSGNCGEYPYPSPGQTGHSGGLSLVLDLDDPRAVILLIKWDARGGFAC